MQHTVAAELVASVLNVHVAPGDSVQPLDEVVVLESMKMEIPVLAEVTGIVAEVVVNVGDVVHEGDPLVLVTIA
jgi:acetyl-CoA carboxylase biotin carboxyl carrier protein